MNEDRKRVLAMLAEGKITADEAERLLTAMENGPSATAAADDGNRVARNQPKYMRVVVDAHEGRDTPTTVNIRVPMQLLRAGVRLSSLIPPQARDRVNENLREQGIAFDINQLKPENLDDLVDHLSELTVNVDSQDAKVRVFCE